MFLNVSDAQLGCPLPEFEPDRAFHSMDATNDKQYDTRLALGTVIVCECSIMQSMCSSFSNCNRLSPQRGHNYQAGDFKTVAANFSWVDVERFDYLGAINSDHRDSNIDGNDERRSADRSRATFHMSCSLSTNGLDTPFYIVGQEPIMKLEEVTSNLTAPNVRHYAAAVDIPLRESVTVINAFCDSHDLPPKTTSSISLASAASSSRAPNESSGGDDAVTAPHQPTVRHVKGWQRNRHVIVARHPDVVDGVRARRRRLELPERFGERAAPHNARPLNVLLLTIDSLASAHFQRTFKQTIAFFDRMQAERRSTVFKFERYHVLGWHSDQNQPGYYAGSNTIAKTNIDARRFSSLLGCDAINCLRQMFVR